MGDLHQPYHCVSKVDHDFPSGDRGGNSFRVGKKDGISNLHMLWDSVLYEEEAKYSLPMSENTWDIFGKES